MTMFDRTLSTRRQSRPMRPVRPVRPSATGFRIKRTSDVWTPWQVLREREIKALEDIGISREDALAEAKRSFLYASTN